MTSLRPCPFCGSDQLQFVRNEDLMIFGAAQPDHNAEVSKKVEVDVISRRAAIDAEDSK